MTNFRNSQMIGINPLTGLGVAQAYWGLNIIGQTQPSRADLFDTGEGLVDGWRACLTEVIDWPYSADVNGYAFDQSNLYGVRSRAWRKLDGSGDKNDTWVAVPKTLGGEYTIQTRHSWLNNFTDTLEDTNPLYQSGTSLQLRSSNSENVFAPSFYAWLPMNRGQEGIDGSIASYGTDPDDSSFAMGLIGSYHIGFRQGNLEVGFDNGVFSGFDNSVVVKIKVRNSGGGSLTTFLTTTLSHTTVGLSGYTYYNIPFSNLLANTTGIPCDFFASCKSTFRDADIFGHPIVPATYTTIDGPPGPIFYTMAPRTDVPLWYFAATGNKCAPGGIVS